MLAASQCLASIDFALLLFFSARGEVPQLGAKSRALYLFEARGQFNMLESLHVTTPLEVVQRQLDAYNAHDLESFMANFSDTVKSYRLPAMEPAVTGKQELAKFYASERFNLPMLRAELISRTVLGNKVFDRERIWGVKEEPIEMVAVFEVLNGLIETIWGFSPE